MFGITDTAVKIANVNPRSEMHGSETVLACDLTLQIRMANTALIDFDPTLRSFLYKKDEEQKDLLPADDHLTKLRFPSLAPLKWAGDLPGYQAIVHYGLGGDSDIKLLDTKLGNFTIEPQEGGTVLIKCRVQAHPATAEIGKLCELIQNEINMTLVPPTEAELFAKNQEKAKNKAALDAHFSAGDDDDDDAGDDDDDSDVVDAEFDPDFAEVEGADHAPTIE